MALYNYVTLTTYYPNNTSVPTASTAKVEEEVVNNYIVIDNSDIYPGVIIDNRP